MCGSTKSTSNQTSTYTPTAQASGLYGNVIGKATDAATGTYDPATGKTIANFDPMQMQAFGAVQGAQGTGQGALNTAGQQINAGGAPITGAQIANYSNPHQQAVIDAAIAQINQQNGVAQSNLAGNAASMQALGGNRVGVAQGTLAGEQGRNMNSTVSGLLSEGFDKSLAAAQNDATRSLQAGQQNMNLGQVQQGMTYQDIQAMLQAGNQQQGQAQSVNDANSSNATAQQMFPYQNAQWLAGIAAALGPLTGSTTTGQATTATPKGGAGQVVGAGLTAASLLSDRRTKENPRVVGKSFDGQNVYEFNYKGSPKRQLGFMADEVRQSHPDAVGQHPSGFEMVDYGRATDDAADRGHFASGGGVGFDSMWNQIKPSAPIMPAPMAAPAAPAQQQTALTPALGKSARAGIDNILRKLSPSQGWAAGTSTEPANGSAPGGTFNLGNMLGFAAGGGVDYMRLFDETRPRRPHPRSLENENIGEIGDSGEAPAAAPWGLPPSMQGAGEDPGALGGSGGFSLGDIQGLPPSMQGLEQEPAPSDEPGNWGMRGIAPTYQGKTMADFLMGRDAPIDMGAEAMPTTGLDEGAGTPPMPERAPGGMSLGDMGLSVMNPGELQETEFQEPASVGMAETVNDAAVPGLSTIDFLKTQEGFTPRATWDHRQHSNGYGTKARTPGEVIDEAEADRRLAHEAGKIESWLDDNVSVPMTGGQRAALVSFGHTLGTGKGGLQNLLGDINAGKWDRVAMRMPSFNKALNEKTGKLEVVDGLTARRIREAALVSGEGAPAVEGSGSAGASPAAQSLVAKATSPDAPVTAGYASPKDKETGGLLKTLFGVDFNPLKLDEDERLSLMAAGLSMMSTGDIGGGGLVGLQHLSKARAATRDAASDAQKLALQMAQTNALSQGKWHPSAGGEIVVNDVTGESRRTDYQKGDLPTPAMKEYELYKDQGGKGSFLEFDNERKLNSVKGEVPSEVAARIELANGWMKEELPGIRKRVKTWSNKDRADLVAGRGEAAEISRRVDAGSEALIRMMTGAGKSAEEAGAYAKRYGISATDKQRTIELKLDGLEKDLTRARKGAITGKTGEMSRTYNREDHTPKSTPRPRARGRDGSIIEYDGSAWVPAP